jgi:hypothetical protein
MSIDKVITDYRDAKEAMQAIIDSHMRRAFIEIKSELGTTPVDVDIRIQCVQKADQKYQSGVYLTCQVRLGGD